MQGEARARSSAREEQSTPAGLYAFVARQGGIGISTRLQPSPLGILHRRSAGQARTDLETRPSEPSREASCYRAERMGGCCVTTHNGQRNRGLR
jgi:hypothetical protein